MLYLVLYKHCLQELKKKEEEEEEEEDTLPADIFVLRIVHFLSTFSTELFLYSRQTSQK